MMSLKIYRIQKEEVENQVNIFKQRFSVDYKKNFLDGVGTFHIGRHSDFELEQDTGLFVTLDGEGCWMFDDHIMTNKT